MVNRIKRPVRLRSSTQDRIVSSSRFSPARRPRQCIEERSAPDAEGIAGTNGIRSNRSLKEFLVPLESCTGNLIAVGAGLRDGAQLDEKKDGNGEEVSRNTNESRSAIREVKDVVLIRFKLAILGTQLTYTRDVGELEASRPIIHAC
ncbi:hypothetical protein TWF569_000201 [Orbilia oligospora]|nr:hypothetical protein TWF569_000201 [Orbilia oligospora]